VEPAGLSELLLTVRYSKS